MKRLLPWTIAVTLALALLMPSRVDAGDAKAREAGPEDGITCCLGSQPFLFNRNDVLAITGRAGVFRSPNRGQLWQRSMEGLIAPNGVSPFVVSRCQAPSDPRIVYVLAGTGRAESSFTGFFSSGDFGASWTRRGPADNGPNGINLCVVDASDPRTLYVYGIDSNFVNTTWKSTDGGQTLQIFSSLPACAAGGKVVSVPGTLYVFAGPQCAYASTDGGSTFRQLAPPPAPFGGFDVSPDGSKIFVDEADASFQDIGTFRSTDGGASFTPVSGVPFGYASLAFDPTDPSRIYLSDGLLRVSTDGGQTFALLPASNDPRFPGPFPVGEIGVDSRGSVYLSTLAGPFRTDDRGRTFRSIRNGFQASSVQDLAFDSGGKLLVGVFHTETLFRQIGGGLNFESIGNPRIDVNGFNNDGVSVAGSPEDSKILLVATDGQGIFRTEDGGQSWTRAAVAGGARSFSNSRMIFPTGSRVYVAFPGPTFFGGGLYRSDDAGGSFAPVSSLPFGAIAVDPRNPDVLYAGTYGGFDGLFKSTDGGVTLQDLGQPGIYSALAVDRRDPKVIYAGERFGQVIRSRDGGLTFSPASSGLTGAGVHGLAQDTDGTLFVWLRGGGLFASRDGAASWQPVDTDEALQRSGVEAGRGSVVVDPRHPGRVYLGNSGVIRIEANGHGNDQDDD